MNPSDESALVEILMLIVSGREPHYCEEDLIEFRDRDNLIELCCATQNEGLVEVCIYEDRFTFNPTDTKPCVEVAVFNPPLYNAVKKRASDIMGARKVKADAEAKAMKARRLSKILSLLKP